ncbi:hypothetical protein DBR47_12270 [Paucibacter sp. KBW04]|uniref:hypothetical protein n=1 Tax=Paucibacter sp. KBW04 TaxID=2153361 RepID=UPI000F56AE00|nr:hypothetical protein [Paucibacter sp. KBW04]RQO58481.1 hypothetical protein DBR47_12270 [Paucibacter sp. KBW04]
MAGEAKDSEQGSSAEPSKRAKTGGRVKKSIDQLMAELRVRDEIAGMRDDTTLPEELAAIYLGVSVAELAEQRKPSKRTKPAGSKSQAAVATPPKIKMIKPIREGAVGQNQKVFYKLGHLREYQESITVESSFDAAVKAGLYGFVSVHAPFFAQMEKRSDRGRAVLIGKAWDRRDPKWADRFKELIDGNLRALWLTPAEAASSRWASLSSHKAFAKPWLDALKVERQAVKAAIEGTEISEIAPEKPGKLKLVG